MRVSRLESVSTRERGVNVASRVTVRLTGAIGLDDADHLLAELAKETGLDWREERPADGKHLAGTVVELLLTAVISGAAGKGAEVAIAATTDHVRKVVSRWRDRRLDPPDAEVVTQDVPEEQVAGNEPTG
jgi:hypothetical protein